MIVTLIGIQTTCVIVATSYIIKNFKPKFSKVRLHSKSDGFKHYKTY